MQKNTTAGLLEAIRDPDSCVLKHGFLSPPTMGNPRHGRIYQNLVFYAMQHWHSKQAPGKGGRLFFPDVHPSCTVIHLNLDDRMSVRQKRKVIPKEQRKTWRISVTFHRELSLTLARIANQGKGA